jgi:hypothetical protein
MKMRNFGTAQAFTVPAMANRKPRFLDFREMEML